jgi:hypothetical protein
MIGTGGDMAYYPLIAFSDCTGAAIIWIIFPFLFLALCQQVNRFMHIIRSFYLDIVRTFYLVVIRFFRFFDLLHLFD